MAVMAAMAITVLTADLVAIMVLPLAISQYQATIPPPVNIL